MMLDLARSRVAQGQLSKVESGKVAPTLEILLGVATKFGKSLDWIVRGESIS
jgi:transcriptional regulator with XRE-family HTH domain